MSEQQMIALSKADALIQQLINLIDPEGAGPNIDWDKARDAVQRWSGDGMNRLPLASMDALLDEIEAISSRHGGRALYRAAVQRWAQREMRQDVTHLEPVDVQVLRSLSDQFCAQLSSEKENWFVSERSAAEHDLEKFLDWLDEVVAAQCDAPPRPSPKTDAAFQDPLYSPSPVESPETKPLSYYCAPCMRDVPVEHKNECPYREPKRCAICDGTKQVLGDFGNFEATIGPCPECATKQKPVQDARKFRGIGELERAGYIPDGSAVEREQSAPPPAKSQPASIFDEPSQRVEGDLVSAGVIDESNFPAKPDERLEGLQTARRLIEKQDTYPAPGATDAALGVADPQHELLNAYRDHLLDLIDAEMERVPKPSRLPCRISEYDGAYRCTVHHRKWGAISKPDEPCEGWNDPERLEFYAVVTERDNDLVGPMLLSRRLISNIGAMELARGLDLDIYGWARVARVTVLGERA